MKTITSKLLRVLFACLAVVSSGIDLRAANYSLAADFTYAENNADSLWSFRLDDYANNPPTFLPLLNSTDANANTLWGTGFADPPMMWSEGTGYWGIGKNLSGVEQAANGVVWAPDEVLLHPKGGASPARLVICWRAPRSMVANIRYTFRKAMPCGNGVGYELRSRIGGVDTELVAFNQIGASLTREQLGVAVTTGDQIFFRIDTWGDAGCDITGAAIEISEVSGPPAIVADPVGGEVSEGGNFTFQGTADNATSYSWIKDGQPVGGANAGILKLINVQPASAGAYQLIASTSSQSVTSAPAMLNVKARATYKTVVVNESFSGYSGNQNALQYQTGLKISHSGTSPGWNRAGGGAIHAVDRTGSGDYAPMIWQDNVLTMAAPVAANQAGETYHVDFVAAPATYAEGTQATSDTDGMVIDILRSDDSILSSFTCNPGTWGTADFEAFGFEYTGDGSGDVRIRISPLVAAGRFGGAIDNLRLATDYVPQQAPSIVAQPVGGAVAEGCNFTLSVTGSGATGYQWRRNGDDILGATTSSLSIVNAEPGDAGDYSVRVSNAAGSILSDVVAVSVTARPAYSRVLLTETFSGYSGSQNALQFETGLKISHSGTVPGWNRAGGGAIHAADRDGQGDYSAMIWQDNVLTSATPIAANESGATYHVDFVAAPATYSEGTQATTETDGIVVDVLRGDFSVLGTYTCMPGAWGTQGFNPYTFEYQGDGTGPVLIRVGPLAASGHFAGQIDNLRVATDFVPTQKPVITVEPVGGIVAEGSDFTLSVVATGAPDYQWMLDGKPISGATGSSYTITDVRPYHAGTYAVQLVNAAGSASSAPAILNVTPWPSFDNYRDTILSDNPIHYYPLDDDTGTTAADVGSLATAGGTYLGGFTLGQPAASTLLGRAVKFAGSSGSLVDLGVYHPGDAVSVEVWAMLDQDAPAGWNATVARWDGSFELVNNSDLGVSFAVRNDANALGQVFSATKPARGLWHHIVGVFSEGNLTVYVDGIKGQEQSIGGVLRDGGPTPDRVMIGATRDGVGGSAFNWKGAIDEVAIYDTALNEGQVRAHFRAGQPASQSLEVRRSSGGVTVSWSSFSPGYSLQSATAVAGPYVNYTGNVSLQGARLSAEVSLDSGPRYFRLYKP